jgi:hypothetical protein
LSLPVTKRELLVPRSGPVVGGSLKPFGPIENNNLHTYSTVFLGARFGQLSRAPLPYLGTGKTSSRANGITGPCFRPDLGHGLERR